MKLRAFLAGALLFAQAALAAGPSMHVQPSFDGVRYTEWRNGDKPQGGICAPTGFSYANLGDGSGSICLLTGNYVFTVLGSNTVDNALIVHKDCGGGDCQVEGVVENSYSGSTEVFAGVMLGIRESTAANSWQMICKSLQVSTTSAQCQYGIPGAMTTVNCAASGANRPIKLIVTRDLSSGDIKGLTAIGAATPIECASTNRALSDDIAFFGGGAKSTSAALVATMSGPTVSNAITAYTPSDPGGGAPVLAPGGIPDQIGTQGVPYTFTWSAYFTGATSYELGSAFPGALTETTDGVLGGTPNATDVSSSPYNRDLCARNASGLTCDDVGFTFFATPPGDVFLVPDVDDTATSTYTCNNAATGANGASWASVLIVGSGTTPGPGDTVRIAGGKRKYVDIINCAGALGNPLVFQNDPLSASKLTIEHPSGATTYMIRCDNCVDFTLRGLDKWSGAPAGTCGSTVAGTTKSSAACGIVLQTDADGAPTPQAWIKFKGLSTRYTIEGTFIDGTTILAGDVGVGIDCDDHNVTAAANPGVWREDINVRYNYIFKNGLGQGEGMYCGPNAAKGDLPHRRMHISYNYVEASPRECINGKSWRQGPNYVDHNWIKDCASAGVAGQNRGINITDGGDVDIFDNVIDNPDGPGISHIINGNHPSVGGSPFYSNIYNNIVWSSDTNSIYVESANAAQDQISPVAIYNNTVVDSTSANITRNVNSGTCEARDNIVAGTNTTVSGCTDTSNTKLAPAAYGANFVNSGTHDYHIKSGSAACEASTNDAVPTTDYEGDPRDQDTHSDDGADEASACP